MQGKIFVGRNHELELLKEGLKSTLRSSRQLFMLAGEPGIGKTALACQLELLAATRGFHTVWARCWEAGNTPAYWPWKAVLDNCKEYLGKAELQRILGGAGPTENLPEALKTEFSKHTDRRTEALPEDPLDDRDRLLIFDAVGEALAKTCEKQPQLLIFEDLHASDTESAQLLLFVIQKLVDARLIVLCSFRDTELMADESSELSSILAKIARTGTQLSLVGLNEIDTEKLCLQLSKLPLEKEDIVEYWKISAGNPLFLTELLRIGTTGRIFSGGPTPLVLGDMARQRISELPESCLKILSTAAEIGREFSILLIAACLGTDQRNVEIALNPAISSRLLEDHPDASLHGDRRYLRFCHDFLREFIVHSSEAEARAVIHRDIARAMEKYQCAEHYSNATIANHYVSAVPEISAERALEKLAIAAHELLRSGAYEESLYLVNQVRRLLPDCNQLAHENVATAYITAARAHIALGKFKLAKTELIEAFDIAEQAKLTDATVAAANVYGSMIDVGRAGPTLVNLLERSLALLKPESSSQRALILARLAQVHSYSTKLALARDYALEARELAIRGENLLISTQVMLFTEIALNSPDTLKIRQQDNDRALAWVEELGNTRLEFFVHEQRIRLGLEAGNIIQADESFALLVKMEHELQNRLPKWFCVTHQAIRDFMKGNFVKAEKYATDALNIGIQQENQNAWVMFASMMNQIYWHKNEPEALIPALDEMNRKAPRLSVVQTGILLIKAACGENKDVVICELDNFLQMDAQTIPLDGSWLASMVFLTEAALLVKHQPSVRALYSLLKPYSHLHAIIYHGAYWGSANRLLGMLAHEMGKLDAAENYYTNAINAESRMRAVAFECYSRLGRAEVRVEQSLNAKNTVHATEILRELSIVDNYLLEKELPRVAQQIEGIRLKLASNPITSAKSTAQDKLRVSIVRENDYWTIQTKGRTHRLRHAKGLNYLTTLVLAPNKSISAIELAQSSTTGASTNAHETDTPKKESLGDAGSILDATAIKQYRHRVKELQEEIAEAETNNDLGMLQSHENEMIALLEQLKSATGLNGNDRKAASHMERARTAVTKQLRGSIRKIEKMEPALGQYLQDCVKTGSHCEYRPSAISPVVWHIKI